MGRRDLPSLIDIFINFSTIADKWLIMGKENTKIDSALDLPRCLQFSCHFHGNFPRNYN